LEALIEWSVDMKRIPLAIERWESVASKRDFALLDQLLADDVVFESPIVHTPQVGRAITTRYLVGAVQLLGGPQARFVRRWVRQCWNLRQKSTA
jgi:hypothetical protein